MSDKLCFRLELQGVMSVKVDAFFIVFLLCISIILTGCQNIGGLEDDTSDLSAQEATEIFSDNPETVNESNAVTETAKAQFAYGEWYLSEWEIYPVLPKNEIEESDRNVCIRTPLVYEENSNGVNIKVEFFVESYRTHSFIQTRLTYTNLTEQTIRINAFGAYENGVFEENGSDDFFLSAWTSKNHNFHNTNSAYWVSLEPGESYTDEIVFYMGPDFSPQKTYTYTAGISPDHGITIPIEVYRAETTVDQSEWPMPEQSSYLDAFPKFELKMTPDPSFYNVDWSDDVRNTYIKLPVSYEENVDGVLIKVEFFQEKYVMYSFIQARVTYTNTNDYPIYTVIGHDVYFAGAFVKNNSEIKSFQYAEPEDFSGFAVDRQYPLTLNQGQSFVGELIYFADNSFFEPDAEYEYILSFLDKNSSGSRPQAYTVTIPIEVCAP